MAEKTKQELVMELAKLQNAMYEAVKLENKGTFFDLEERTQKAFGALMQMGMSPKEIKEEVEEMLKNSL
jgi:hypothetical protein